MQIKSVFENNGRIPGKYSCSGENISPPLEMFEIPEKAKTLAIIVDDPDAPVKVWVHWIVFNIKVSGKQLKINENQKIGISGINDSGKLNYVGPCPPSGTHRYFFKVYALDSELNLKEGASKKELEEAMINHLIDKAQLIGLFSKN